MTMLAELKENKLSNVERCELLSQLLNIPLDMVTLCALDQILELMMFEARRIVNADRTTLYLTNKPTEEIIGFIVQKTELDNLRLAFGQGIAGNSALTRETINLPDAYAAKIFDPSWDKITGYKTGSVLCVPVIDEDQQVAAVLQALNRQVGCFSANDEFSLKQIATMLKDTINDARHLDEPEIVFRNAMTALETLH